MALPPDHDDETKAQNPVSLGIIAPIGARQIRQDNIRLDIVGYKLYCSISAESPRYFGVYDMTTKTIVNKNKYSLLLGRGLEAYRILGYSHEDAERGSRRNRDFNRDRLLHIGETIGEGSVKHANYRACDMAVALILTALTADGGMLVRESIREASSACYGWTKFTDPDNTATVMHPIMAALEGIERDELWVLRVDIRKSDQTGKIAARAVLYDGEGQLPGNDFPDGYLPHVTMLVHLGPLLKPLVGAVAGRIGTN